jgi:nucleotide-binding universal stress UspA family protein
VAVRILIGTDGSDDALAAARRGLELLASDATVHLISVTERPEIVDAGMESGFAGGIATPQEVDHAWAGAIDEATAALARTVDALGAAPIETSVETSVEHGDPGSLLCERAKSLGADVVVVGSRGRGAIRRALLGSVSTYVVNNAPCPVLVVRAGTAPEPQSASD